MSFKTDMSFKARVARTILVVASAVVGVNSLCFTGGDSSPRHGPIVRVMSPQGGYVMQPVAGKRLLIAMEIVDTSGAGIKTNRSGMPQFIDPDRNVSLFASEVVTKGSYIDSNGQEVIQIVSLVPAEKMVLEDKARARPPVNLGHIRPTEGQRTVVFPDEAMIPFAQFRFQVEDLQGNRSSPDAGVLIIGFASGIFEPSE